MKYLMILSICFMFGCRSSAQISMPTSIEKVDTIKIEVLKELKNYEFTDKETINLIMSKYIATAKKEPIKFIALYKIIVISGVSEYTYLIKGRNINHNGLTYKMKEDFGEFISSLKD
ncbi:MAG: hypothetical protein NZM44_01310 [Candidatus Calescibacterium sp.]|nr:hypothetical protein [Candidatus Calescibacterium sp.]